MLQGELFPTAEDAEISPFDDFCRHLGVEQHGFWADKFGLAVREWSKETGASRINVLSLFSGAGGLDIGFHDAGFNITHAVEIDERFAQSLTANAAKGGYIDGTNVVCKDIRDFSLPKGTKVDFIIGGPPCQTFSAAGRRASGVLGTQDERGTLFQEYVRLLNELQPEGFLFENVYGIVGAEAGKPWAEIQQAFSNAGYRIESRIVDAADYGVAQHRERLIIVGTKSGSYRFPRPTHGPDSPKGKLLVSAEQVLEGSGSFETEADYQLGGRYGHLLEQIPPGLNYSYFTEELGHPKPIFAWRSKFSDFLYKAAPEKPVRTLKAQGGQYTGPFHWRSRPFSVAELKRLQSFPDAYKIEGGRQVAIHQIGNSVPPQLSRVLALTVLEQIFDVSIPICLPTLEAHEELGFRKRKRRLTEDYKSKATKAIALLSVKTDEIAAERIYHADLSSSFEFKETRSGQIAVNSCLNDDRLEISVGLRQQPLDGIPAMTIALRSDPGRVWALGTRTVVLKFFGLDMRHFTAGWKALESELIFRGIKADLVQFCGYYQYAPSFSCRMSLSEGADWRWAALQKIVAGIGVRQTLPTDEFAEVLGIESEDVLLFASFLKECGYEARSRATNPQIPEDFLLVPYAFPTLSAQSVQLRKKIVSEEQKHD